MDRELIERKLEALRHAVERVRTRCPATAEVLRADEDAQDIVAVNLTRAVQLCVDIASHIIAEQDAPPPTTMASVFESLVPTHLAPELCERMRKAVGFRNIAIHSYEAIDWAIVHSICTERLDDFRDFARAISRSFP